MTDRPILFSGPMVRALMEGRKTQTRRVLTPGTAKFGSAPKEYWQHGDFAKAFVDGQPEHGMYLHVPCHSDADDELGDARCGRCFEMGWETTVHRLWPVIEVGDRLWVRESGWERPERTARMMRDGADTWPRYVYDADGLSEQERDELKCWHWRRRPGIHMPRWSSRLMLSVREVRVQRLQEISEGDALAEGVDRLHFPERGDWGWPQRKYRELWDHLNAARGFGWNSNPWVIATTFSVEKINIDKVAA